MENKEKKLLLQISNLKQYFPVGKGRYVRANDGITLDIYEGETLGLVGESGCGKSTLGRSILQLYKQTDGRTMYFGRSIDEMAPQYAYETFKTLTKRRADMKAKQEKYKSFRAEYDKLEGNARYQKHDEMVRLRKEANDAMLDVTTLIGGLFVHPNLAAVEQAYMAQYKISKELSAAVEKRADADLDVQDLTFALEKVTKEGKTDEKLVTKLASAQAKLDGIEAEIKSINARLAEGMKKINALREECKDVEGYEEFEAQHTEGIDLARLKYSEMRKLRSDLQLIFQDPYSSLNPRMTVGQIIGEGLTTHKFFKPGSPMMKEYILKVMEQCGLQDYMLHRYPHQFSGGQRQRICIARALAVKPKFIVCDECVSALDVSIQSQIINLLEELKEKENLTYLFISHDLSVVRYISDRIGVMYLGNMVEMGTAEEIFADPRHPYTVALLSSIPTTDVNALKKERIILEGNIPSPIKPPDGCKFHTRCYMACDKCKRVPPPTVEVKPGHFVACHFLDQKIDENGNYLFETPGKKA